MRSRMGGVWIILISAASVLLLLLIFILQNGSRQRCLSSARTEPCRWGWRCCWPRSSVSCSSRYPARYASCSCDRPADTRRRASRRRTRPPSSPGRRKAQSRRAQRSRSTDRPQRRPQFDNPLWGGCRDDDRYAPCHDRVALAAVDTTGVSGPGPGQPSGPGRRVMAEIGRADRRGARSGAGPG